MSEQPESPYLQGHVGHLELVGKSEEHEPYQRSVLFRLDDSSLSDEDIQNTVSDALDEHFTLAAFRPLDTHEAQLHILYSVLADARVIADAEYYDELLALHHDQRTDDEQRILLQTAAVRQEITNDAVEYLEQFATTGSSRMFIRETLEDFIDAQGLRESNILRIFEALAPHLQGHREDIVIASRLAKTMLYLTYCETPVTPADEQS